LNAPQGLRQGNHCVVAACRSCEKRIQVEDSRFVSKVKRKVKLALQHPQDRVIVAILLFSALITPAASPMPIRARTFFRATSRRRYGFPCRIGRGTGSAIYIVGNEFDKEILKNELTRSYESC